MSPIEKDLKIIQQQIATLSVYPRWLDMKRACKYSSMSENTLLRHIINGDIYGKKIDGKWYIDRESVDAYMLEDNVTLSEKVLNLVK